VSTPQFSRPGAVDLSALRKPEPRGPVATGSFVVELTDEESVRTEVVNRSMSVVVLLSVWAPDVPESVQINDTLSTLAEEFGGRFVLATLDARANASLVSTLGIPSIPLVAAALRGQLAPLIQDPLPEPEMRRLVQEVLQAAASGGVTGTAQPAAQPAGQQTAESDGSYGSDDEPPSRYPEAEAALLRGDLDQAVQAYGDAVRAAPNDAEAAIGLARAQLLQRTLKADDARARRAASDRPDDVDAQNLVADLDLMAGHVQDAFDRLLALVRRTTGTERDAARRHLLELFSVVGEGDPRVGAARRALTAALF
jgi:putative thioredoxin